MLNRKAFTLIEILVAMSIFAFVLTMASMGFVGVFKSSARINLERKLQEDSRFVMERIVKDIRNSQIDFASAHIAQNFDCGPDSESSDNECYAAYTALEKDEVAPSSVELSGAERLYLLSANGQERTIYSWEEASAALFRLTQTYKQQGTSEVYNWTPELEATTDTFGSNLTPEEINVTNIKFFISPARDPHRFNEVPEIQVQPTVTIILETQLNTASSKVPDFFAGEAPSLELQTTITSRYYDTVEWQAA
ncbi:MAG: prepilin-type N-terminal cleavage/methylation domain-containing protein [Candidatus Gracilibacteria bacterium]|nr:prepilin-type N-terminal cleavage/methylation domain-containing protein [Candidatus Gracilibacteria bacterium]